MLALFRILRLEQQRGIRAAPIVDLIDADPDIRPLRTPDPAELSLLIDLIVILEELALQVVAENLLAVADIGQRGRIIQRPDEDIHAGLSSLIWSGFPPTATDRRGPTRISSYFHSLTFPEP